MPPMLRPSSIAYINVGTTMPNGGSHFRSALQLEKPSPCQTSDEEWVQAAKEAWPRPRILTRSYIRAWHTLVVRSRVATALRRCRLIPRIIFEHYSLMFDHLASFLARRAYDPPEQNASSSSRSSSAERPAPACSCPSALLNSM